MPNKDSFTFSDKLRKSKSVPLSKRLPSIVGGKNTQKRTLVQRAQRDLPFILVAALALLLLPFLSRTGSDDIASTENIAWNTLTDAPSFAEGGGADIMPAGTMKDPLEWIVSPRSSVEGSEITASDSARSAYGSGSGSSSGSRYGSDDSSGYGSRRSSYTSSSSSSTKKPTAKNDYNNRKSYEESYTTKTTKKPATTTYGQKTRAGVRKSFERKNTDINRDLRISQMHGQRGSANVSHNLPIGQGPNRGSASTPREGIRPVALQPMEARGGVGRSMTGENLYAEAARSIREMNAGGPAKANLLAAQMRDVDGKLTPEGPFGGPGSGASVRPGAGGNGPGNNNGYNIGKPWWWDMMQTRSQKMWDLLYYKPREIFWNNIYNYMSQLMNCLATGNKDGDVSTMFGKSAADSDFMCIKNDREIMVRYNKQKTSKTTDKDGKTTEETIDSNWFLTCQQLGGESIEKKKDDKGFWEVRAECVGLDVLWDRLKSRIKHTRYDSNCLGVNDDTMSFTLDIERSNARGKHNTRRENKLKNKTVIALLAKVKDGKYKGKEIVVYAQQGNTLSEEGANFAKYFNQNNQHCTLSHLVAFVSRKTTGQIEHVLDIYNDNRRLWQGEVTAGRTICGSGESKFDPATLDDIRRWTDLGKGKKIEDDITPRYAECNIWEAKPDKISKKINGEPCEGCCEIPVDIKQTTEFEATINNTKDKHVFAVLVEQIDQETDAIVTYIVDFGTGEEGDGGSLGLKNCDKNGNCDFQFTANIASLGLVPNEYRKTVATGYGNAGNSSRSSTDNTQSNQLAADDADKTRADEMAKYKECQEKREKEITLCNTKTGDDLKICMEYVQKCNDSTARGNFSGDSNSSSSGSDIKTARGSGIIFWIVTGKNASLKVKLGDKVGQTIHDVKISDLISVSESFWFSVCRYRWCDDIGYCGVPQRPSPKDYCVEDGKAYLAQKIPLDGQDIYIKVKDLGPADGISIAGLPPCVILCHDPDGNVHICDNDGEPKAGEPVCPLSKIPEEYRPIVPPCPSCCSYTTHDGITSNYKSVEIDGRHYIVDATPNACNKPKGECIPAAWSKEGDDLIVYDMSTYDPNCLKFIPGESAEPFKTCTGTGSADCPQVDLTELDPEPFALIHDQSYRMDPNLDPNLSPMSPNRDPQFFELFPQLTLPNKQDVEDACKIRLKFNYQNASYSPQPPVNYDTAAQAIAECIKKIKVLKQSGTLASDEDYSTLYFHGFASYGGNEYKNCDGKTQTGPQCNVALSEDRNLYVMDQITEILGRDFSIGKVSATTSDFGNPKELNGFTNTNDNNPCKPSPCISFPYRYGKEYTDTQGTDIIFKSVPHGEKDATRTSKQTMSPDEIEKIHAPDRFIVIDIKPSVTRADVKDDSSYKEYSNDGYNINSPSRTPGSKRI